MGNFIQLIYYLLLALYAFFVVAPCVLNAVSLYGVQKQFNEIMIEEKIVSRLEVNKLHPKKQVGGVVVSLILLLILVNFAARLGVMGFASAGVPLLAGLFKYRGIVQFNSLTAKRFRTSYEHVMDGKKFNRYIDKHF